jgi:hypothetical protein
MRALVDHRGHGFAARGVGKALLFFVLAFTGWAAGRALSPPSGPGGDRS